jgi:hypothetical protein
MLLCERHGVGPGKLGLNAGLSDEAVPQLIKEARRGFSHPGRVKTYWLLSQFYGVSVDWLLNPAPLPTKLGKP